MELNYKDRIKSLREKDNISQQQIADYLKIKRSSYNQFEQQYDIIPIRRLAEVADFLNVSVDYLLGLTDVKNYEKERSKIDWNLSSKRFKEYRKINNLTQEDMAKSIKFSKSVIGYHERKRTMISTPNLFLLCQKYQLSADYLLGKIDYPDKIRIKDVDE